MKNKIEQLINNNKIFLFMKGTPEEPQCGFSFHVIQILRNLDVEYGYFNVLSDDMMREAVKEYANWPTYPQLWVDGNLVGGCDIVMQLFEQGKLKEMLL